MKYSKLRSLCLWALAGILLFPSYSYAYLDGGTGSYLVSLVLAAMVGASVYFRSILSSLKGLFKKKEKNKEPLEPPSSEE